MTIAVKKSFMILASVALLAGLTVPVFTARAEDEFPGDIDQGRDDLDVFPGDIDQGRDQFPGDIEQPEKPERERPEIEKECLPAKIKVIKFKDFNGNGQEDNDEPRMGGVAFNLTGRPTPLPLGWRSILNFPFTDNVKRTAVTDSNGVIVWDDLQSGNYTVTEVVPDGFIVTTANPQKVSVVCADTRVVKFGNKPVVIKLKAQVEVIKFKDVDGDGFRDDGEVGMGGVTFHLKKDGQIVITKLSNEAGIVEFPNLEPGNYTIEEIVPAGFVVTTANPQTVVLADKDHKVLFFGNKPPQGPPPPPPPPTLPTPPELPKTGPMEVFLPTSVGLVTTLAALALRQRRYMVDLLRGL